MRPLEFPGTYQDAKGVDAITWRIQSSERRGWSRRYEIQTTVRGIDIWGGEFDSLTPDDLTAPGVETLTLDPAGDLVECVFTGELPCVVDDGAGRRDSVVRFVLDLRQSDDHPPTDPKNLELSHEARGQVFRVVDDWFEDGVQRLEALLPPPMQLVCCVTCAYSDYSPGGHGLMGMQCHRDAKVQYLAVKSKADYWHVPMTEEVPETYLCPEYERRVPGTGYRG